MRTRSLLGSLLLSIAALSPRPALAAPGGAPSALTPDALRATLQLLVKKGLITQTEHDAALAGPAPPPAAPAAMPESIGWDLSLFGFLEFDAIYDTTQSFNELPGNSAVARPESYAGQHGRMTFSVRHSRVGLRLRAPEFHRFVASALFETDFLGNQPAGISDASLITNPGLRIRHFYTRLDSPYFSLLIGQYWQLFGGQPLYQPSSVTIHGLPGEAFARAPQVRLTRQIHAAPVTLELAIAASRPPQRDSLTPDGQGAVRVMVDGWTGAQSVSATGGGVAPLSFSLSGVIRRFAVPELLMAPRQALAVHGYGFSIDAFIPVIRATAEHRKHALSLQGSFVEGRGLSDLYTGLSGGTSFPAPLNAVPGGRAYVPDIDNGLVGFDASGQLEAIHWRSFIVGAQYYLPPRGQVWVSGNFAQLSSDNAARFGDATRVFTRLRWADANVFWDVMPALRLGLEYSFFRHTYADGVDADNHRVHLVALYMF